MERARRRYLCMAVREHLSHLSPGCVTQRTSCEKLIVLLTLITVRIRTSLGSSEGQTVDSSVTDRLPDLSDDEEASSTTLL